jgi:hypothetical protein
MGFLIAYLLGIVTAAQPKYHYGNYFSDSTNTTQNHPTPDRPIAILCVPPPESHEEKTKKKNKNKREIAKFVVELISAVLLLGYLGATVLIWIATRNTAKDTHQSVVNADKNFRIDERAWMAFGFKDQGNITFTFNKSFLIPTELRNTGKTPAKNIHGNIVVSIFKKGESLDFTYTAGHAHYGIKAGTIFPSGNIVESFEAIKHGQEHAEPIIFTAPIKDDLFKARSFLIAYGRIDYTDIFGGEHWMTFCRYVLHPELISEDCTRYNDTDND